MTSKYGTHRRISEENMERIKKVGEMGDSVNDVVGKLLNFWEDEHKNRLTIDELQAVYDLAVAEDHSSDSDDFIDLLESASDKLFSIIDERKKKEQGNV